MSTPSTAVRPDEFTLSERDLSPSAIFRNLSPAALYEQAIARGEGTLTDHGALVANPSPHTDRSLGDEYTVDEPSSSTNIWWATNARMDPAVFDELDEDVRAYLSAREVFVQDLFAGADPDYRLPVRFITPNACNALFVRNMFIQPRKSELRGFRPGFTVLHAPDFEAEPTKHGTRSGAFVALNFGRRLILVGGTRYAGEMKQSVFTVLNYLLPEQDVFPMHCSANIGPAGDCAIFFGLSGTGKTALSADPQRDLIGDDEHGWSNHGVFNLEGGCYVKTINLSKQNEPEIYTATQRFGTVLENVVLDPAARTVDFDDDSITENSRAAFPLAFMSNYVPSGIGEHPKHVVFLTTDAYGVMPPIARLTPEQAMYHFLSGYTARVAGIKRGVTEPQATFSACFGAPFLPRDPGVYAEMLGERLRQHGSAVWMVNTGWSGGPYGIGSRIKIRYSRAMVNSALSGKLDGGAFTREPVFGMAVPMAVPGVPHEILVPRETWPDPKAYDTTAQKLVGMFRKNFEQYRVQVPSAVVDAGPIL